MTQDNVDTVIDISTDIQAQPDSEAMASNLISKANTNEATHSLKDNVERFVVIDSFNWVSEQPVLGQTYTRAQFLNGDTNHTRVYSFPDKILDASQLIRQKLNNFGLMRSDLEIDVKVNSQSFQQGALLICYSPRTPESFKKLSTETLPAVSSFPHRILQLEEGNSMRMVFPYANEADYFDLTTPENQFGSVYLYVLSPLKDGSDHTFAHVTVRARFVNVDLKVPTDNSILANTKFAQKELEALTNQVEKLRLKAQGGEGDQGIISKISSTVAGVAGAMTAIPGVSKIATPVAWAARAVNGLAQTFGFSKPIDTRMTNRIAQSPGTYMSNFEGNDSSIVLAGIPDNAIDSSDMIPSDQDEMALKYVTSRPNILSRYTVSASNFTAKQLLFKIPVTPVPDVQMANKSIWTGTLGYAALMAFYWRGALNYSFQAVKTTFHSGRFIVVYFPNSDAEDIPDTYSETMTTNLNILYDLKAKSGEEHSLEKSFTVPYSQNVPWKRTLVPDPDTDLGYNVSRQGVTNGYIGVYSFTDLVYPDTVSDTIDFVVRYNAGEDFQIGLPTMQIRTGYPNFSDGSFVSYFNNKISSLNLRADTKGLAYDLVDSDTDPEVSIVWNRGNDTEPTASWLTLASQEEVDGLPMIATIKTSTDFYEDQYYQLRFWQDGEFILSDPLPPAIETNVTTKIEMIRQRLHAQGGETDVMPTPGLLAPVTDSDMIEKGTMGEYLLSLRQLTKRFCSLGKIRNTATYYPSFNHDVTDDETGRRKYRTDANVRSYLPESWMSLVSNLYRFYAGGFRTKTMINFNDSIYTGVKMASTNNISSSKFYGDPLHRFYGVNTPMVEVQVPFYSNYRARIVGGDRESANYATQYLWNGTDDATSYDFFEAAADDLSFWFLVGPPPVTCLNYGPTEESVVSEESHVAITHSYVPVVPPLN